MKNFNLNPSIPTEAAITKGKTCLNPHIHVVLLFELEMQVKLDSHDGSRNLKQSSFYG